MTTNDRPLKEVIQEMLSQYRLENKLAETRIINGWGKVVGKMVAKYTKDIYIKNKTLYVRVMSAAVKNELSYARTKIIAELNKEAEAGDYLKEIVLL